MHEHQGRSSSLDPFATGNADEIFRCLEAQIVRTEPSLPWRSRAVAFAKVAAPLLACLRDANGVGLTREKVRMLMQFDTLAVLCGYGNRASLPDEVANLPEAAVSAVRCYMEELPGFDPSVPTSPDSPPRIIHFHALSAFRHCLG